MKLRLAFLLLLLPCHALAQTQVTPGSIRCGRLLDVRSGRILTNQVVSFDTAGVITSVGASTSTPVVADLPNATCLPGLIDVHTHITGDANLHGYRGLAISVPRQATIGVKNARITLHAGFTTIRNVGASDFTDVAVRDAVNAGEVEGPRMLVSGPPLSITGGHCDSNLLPFEFHRKTEGVADGPWAARQKVRENIK